MIYSIGICSIYKTFQNIILLSPKTYYTMFFTKLFYYIIFSIQRGCNDNFCICDLILFTYK